MRANLCSCVTLAMLYLGATVDMCVPLNCHATIHMRHKLNSRANSRNDYLNSCATFAYR